MNSLRALIESGFILARNGFHREDLPTFQHMFQKQAESAMCFDLGEINYEQEIQRTLLDRYAKLPYSTCWFESIAEFHDGQKYRQGVLATTNPVVGNAKNPNMFFLCEKIPAGWCLLDVLIINSIEEFLTVNYKTTVGFYMWRDGLEPDIKLFEEHRVFMLSVYSFLVAIACRNTKLIETKPSDKLQINRAKKGKFPLFSYWTLKLSGKNQRMEDQSDNQTTKKARRSPRVHMRRGHVREYKKAGKLIWVQEAIVGTLKNGIVHKDYAASNDF